MTETATETTLKLIANRDELLYALSLANEIVKARTPKPILQCVKISASEVVKVQATDMERCIETTLTQVQLELSGEACVPCEKLLKIIQTCHDDAVYLRVEGQQLMIASGDRDWKMATMNASDFPPVEFTPKGDAATVNGAKLGRAIKLAKVCIDNNAIQGAASARNAFYLASNGGVIDCGGTDGNAGCFSELASEGTATWEGMIFQSFLAPIEKMSESESLSIYMSENRAWFAGDETIYSLPLLEGKYFPYKDFNAKEATEFNLVVQRESLADSLESVAVMLTELTNRVKWDITETRLILSTGTGEGTANAPLPCKSDKPITIGLQPKYMTAVLKLLDGEDLTIGINSPSKPVFIRQDGFTFVQMPMTLKE